MDDKEEREIDKGGLVGFTPPGKEIGNFRGTSSSQEKRAFIVRSALIKLCQQMTIN